MSWDDHDLPSNAPPAATIAAANEKGEFLPPPFGEHVFLVMGFAGNPNKSERKDAYINGRNVGFNSVSVGVKLALLGSPDQGLIDWFLLPPNDPGQHQAYFFGTNENGKAAGFQANKLIHFIERLGFIWPAGEAMPADARRLGNWRGRKVIANVGQYKNNRQIELFSYRLWTPDAALQKTLPAVAATPAPQAAYAAPANRSTTGLETLEEDIPF